jgi:hypothetical protein
MLAMRMLQGNACTVYSTAMAFTRLENGHLIPLPEHRIAFAREVSMFIQLAIFQGQRELHAEIEGVLATLALPHEAEILNFVTLNETEEAGVIDVHLCLPVIMGQQRHEYRMCVRYAPLLDEGGPAQRERM